jgi:glycosyltransferase involved in cell wall biosynthesis
VHVLILTAYFPPEVGGASHLYFELAETLARRGHDVCVVTGFPRYNVDKLPERYASKLVTRERISGFRLIRLWVPPIPRENLLLRGLEHWLVPATLLVGGLGAGPYDVVLTISPPLPFGLAAYGLSRLRRAPFVFNVQDLFPEEVVQLGLMRNRALILVFEAIERFIYRRADCVTVHSPGNQEHIVAHGGRQDRTEVVYNWVDVERIQPSPRENAFRRTHGLTDRFVVSYAGTMGLAQDMTVIVEAAHRLRHHEDIVFLMVGDGPDKADARSQAARLDLDNMVFLPTQPWSVYPDVLAASDVSLINLHANLTTPVVPSKLMSIMAAGRPVIASVPSSSDAFRIVSKAACGLCTDAGDADGLAAAALELYRNPNRVSEMGRRGRHYAEDHFSRESCVSRYEEIFRRIYDRERRGD